MPYLRLGGGSPTKGTVNPLSKHDVHTKVAEFLLFLLKKNSIQNKSVSLEVSKMLKNITKSMQTMSDERIDSVLQSVRQIAEVIEQNFPDKRSRKVGSKR